MWVLCYRQRRMMKNGQKIYLIDDDASVRKALRRFLISMGLQVDVFDSAEDFLDRVSSSATGCLILDVRMPGLSGLELQDRLMAAKSQLSLIFITAFANPPDCERAMKAGAIAYLTKPIDDRILMDALQEAGAHL